MIKCYWHMVACAIALLTTLTTFASGDDTTTDLGDYVIRHTATRTDFLEPEVASAYGIRRSKYRGLLTLAIREDKDQGRHVNADFSVTLISGTRQRDSITIWQVKEQDATYYLGVFPIYSGQRHLFLITVTPEGHSAERHEFQLEKVFSSD